MFADSEREGRGAGSQRSGREGPAVLDSDPSGGQLPDEK